MARTTLADIARMTGADPATVSRVLRGLGDAYNIGQQRQQKILKAAEALHYRPNRSARATVTGRFGSVGLLLSDDPGRSWVPATLLRTLQEHLADAGYAMVVDRLPPPDETRRTKMPRVLAEQMVDGVLIAAFSHRYEPLMRRLQAQQVPAIWLSAHDSFEFVAPDNVGAGREAVRHLTGLGHRDIAYLRLQDTATADGSVPHPRLNGYLAQMKALRLQPQVLRYPRIDEASRNDLIDLLTGDDRPTALICRGHAEASFLARTALHAGIRIPADISVMVICSDEPHALISQMTRLVVPEHQRGEAGVAMLLQKIENPTMPIESRLLEMPLIDAGTCRALSETHVNRLTQMEDAEADRRRPG